MYSATLMWLPQEKAMAEMKSDTEQTMKLE